MNHQVNALKAVVEERDRLRVEVETLRKRPGTVTFGRVMREFLFDSDGDIYHVVCDRYFPPPSWDRSSRDTNAPLAEIINTAINHLSTCKGAP